MTTVRTISVSLLVAICALTITVMAAPCNTPEHRQFDFWLGDWEVFEVGDEKVPAAHVLVEALLDDCVLHEIYEDPSGLRGESFSIYDAPRKVWHQTWVTNRGQLLTLEGRKRGDELLFEGSAVDAKGIATLYRAVWKQEDKEVRETAETSIDGGKTWKQWFDLRFRLRRS